MGREYQKQYYERNKERIREYNKQNKERNEKYRKEYYEENKERLRAKRRIRYANNEGNIKDIEILAEYMVLHKDEILALQQKYSKDSIIASRIKRRLKHKKAKENAHAI